MPYIKKENRECFNDMLIKFNKLMLNEYINEGELNYLITKIVNSYTNIKGLKYKTINQVIGVLECVKTEYNRRIVAPYEDEKIKENGDV